MDAVIRMNNTTEGTFTRAQKEERLSAIESSLIKTRKPVGRCAFCGTTEEVEPSDLLCPECDSEMQDLSEELS